MQGLDAYLLLLLLLLLLVVVVVVRLVTINEHTQGDVSHDHRLIVLWCIWGVELRRLQTFST
jgi:hypothetical protein